MSNGHAGQVLDVLRDVLIEHMDDPEALDHYRVQSAVFIGHSGRLISDNDILRGADIPAGLRLTMRTGDEFDLMFGSACQAEEEDEEATA
jgi:hypothetical protein